MSDEVCEVVFMDEAKVARVGRELADEASCQGAADLFKLLSEPLRLRTLLALSIEPLCVCDLSRLLGASQSNLSHQLRLLRTAGLVAPRRQGKMVYYYIERKDIKDLIGHALSRPEGKASPNRSAE